MKTRWSCAVLIFAAAATGAAAQSATAASTSVTLFTSGKVLVRRTLPVALPRGRSTHAFELGNFTPATLQPLDSGVVLVRINSDLTWSEDALLRRNIGRSFGFRQPDKTVGQATLLSLDPEHWRWADGGVVFGRPGTIIWPAARVPASRVADVTLDNDRPRDSIRVTYATGGGSRFANYALFLGPGAHLDGTATVSAGTLDLAKSEVQLFAGDIGAARLQPVRPSVAPTGQAFAPGQAGSVYVPRDAVTTRQTVGESIAGARLYTLPGTISFVAGSQTVIPLFDRVPVVIGRRYIVGGGLSMHGPVTNDRADEAENATIAYLLSHDAGTRFGDLALPQGNVNIYDRDDAGRVELVGQVSIDHTPEGADLQIEAGTSYDVQAVTTQTEFLESPSANSRGTAVAGYRVEVHNASDTAAAVEVRVDHNGEWSILNSSLPVVRRTPGRSTFETTVPAHGTASLSYRVRVVR
jgi:hypothetical protein